MRYSIRKDLRMIDKILPDGGPISLAAVSWIGGGIAIAVIAALTWCKLTEPDEFRDDHRRRR